MTLKEVLDEFKARASEKSTSIMENQGATNAMGVKVEDMKKIVKRIKQNKSLSLELFATGIPDAQYMAGLISAPEEMTREEIQLWAETANYWMISEHPVAWAVSEGRFAMELATEWIDSPEEKIASCGWASLAAYVSMRSNDEIDFALIEKLLDRAKGQMAAEERNRVRYTMNGFIIAVGAYCPQLTDKCIAIGNELGTLKIKLAGAGCKVPFAPEHIRKAIERGSDQKKRKSPRC